MARVRGWLAASWDLVGADLPVFSIAAFLVIAGSLLTGCVLALPGLAGLCLMFLEKMNGRRPSLSQFGEALTRFPATIIVWIAYLLGGVPFLALHWYCRDILHLSSGWGVAVEFVGHFVVATPLFFAVPLVADRDLDGWEAVRLSWARARTILPTLLLAVIVYTAMLVLGLIACGVGIILTLPVVAGALMLAYRDLCADFQVPVLKPLLPATAETETTDEEHKDTAGPAAPGGAGE